MRTRSLVVCLVGLLLLFISSVNAEMRTWTRKNGKTFEAEFVKREGPVVTLKKPDGAEMTVRMPNLSDDDRKYVNQLTKGNRKAKAKEGDRNTDEKPADATWRMVGEYPSLAGGWVESQEGKRYVTITQDGNKFVGKSNVFKLEDKADHQYRVEGTVSKGGRITGKITSSKDGHDDNPGPMTGTMDSDGKTVHLRSNEGESWSNWTLAWNENQGDEPKHAGKKPRRKAEKVNPAPQPDDTAFEQRKTMIVDAKGSGKDRDEALKDAFRDAVRKVVGAYLETETVVKNDHIIKDEVLSYSGGCVKDHGILSEKSEGGLVEVSIWALVEQDKVVKRLKAANVSVKEVAGGKMWDEIQSKRWKDKEAADLLRSVLKGFPANCMRAEVVGEPKHEDKGDKIEVTVTVQFYVDEKAFQAFRERLMAALDHIADESKDFLVVCEENNRSKGFYNLNPPFQLTTKDLFLCVNTTRNELWTRLGFRKYHLDKKLEPALLGATARTCECVLSSPGTDGKSQPIAMFDPQLILMRKPGMVVYQGIETTVDGHAYVVGGTFFFGWWGSNLSHSPKVSQQHKIDMTENELKNLSKIKCELRWSEGNPQQR